MPEPSERERIAKLLADADVGRSMGPEYHRMADAVLADRATLRAQVIEECARSIESEIVYLRRIGNQGAGLYVGNDGDLVDITWNRACRNLAAKLRALLPAPEPADG